MTGRKFVATMAAVVAVAGIAALALYLYRPGHLAPPSIEQGPAAGEGLAPDVEPAKPQAAAPAEQPSKPPAEASGAPTPPSKPAVVPSFDVVLVEPNGEGVIAGRAEPGWQVSVQSGGTKVAEAVADEQGEWSVVLEKPLPPGDHALSLRTTSPDGTRALTSQQSVAIAVGKPDEETVASVPDSEKPVEAAEQKGSAPATSEPAPKAVPDAVTPAPQAETLPQPAQEEADRQVAAKVETKPEETAPPALEAAPPVPPAAQPKTDLPAEVPTAAIGTKTTQEQASKELAPTQPAPQVADAVPGDRSLVEPPPSAQPAPVATQSHSQPAKPPSPAAEPGQSPGEVAAVPPAPPVTVDEPAPSTTSQAGEAKPGQPSSPPKAPVVFKTVGYEDKGTDTGTMALTGTSEPGSVVQLYFDDEPLAKVQTDSDGQWSFATERPLALGKHTFRAERLDQATGSLAGSAMVTVERVKPAPQVAAKEPAPQAQTPAPLATQPVPAPSGTKPSEAAPSPAPSPQVAAVETGKEQTAPQRKAQRKKAKPKVYTVRRGDTLWDIARRYLGGGWRYTSIYRDNRKLIRDPDEIVPNQKVKLPKS